ncbi:carbamoyltransferase HypF [uncultured Cohaesibacter sp.]|uniref:carbamoyltransferase HypF n=1 Tax=uncultured Cohaesibacter sp. TaxID=1002546 RepID=UPI00292CA660|nr:carbamoyltransferase HypF [uncultured Cohaesibacter sp.]
MFALSLIIRGQVQGVGFRPTVWRLARECGLTGDVKNTGEGVEVRLWGEMAERFEAILKANLPRLARIDSIVRYSLSGAAPQSFEIVSSQEGGVTQLAVTPDMATCPDCLNEIRDPGDRRYRYPFNNCTNCGPRFTIVQSGPYDRAKTTMTPFVMCEDCAGEFANPADRRFHAQPVACPHCGPTVWIEDLKSGARVETDDSPRLLADLILAGHIVAIRGLGGVHLACDATNASTVGALRMRKRRKAKAFAMMARDLEAIGRYVAISTAEAAVLTSPAAPILLLYGHGETLPEAVAPGLSRLGFMLPHTPLHHLLFEHLDRPLIMTSGNISGHPQCTTNEEIRDKLSAIADFALMHDREIANRIDDSVVAVDLGEARILRRARGYAPQAITLPDDFPQNPCILAMGSELKNTFCLTQNGQAILSQHMGDLEDAATNEEQRYNLALFSSLFHHHAERLIVDAHPDYLSTQFGYEMAKGRPVTEVQHHHAHIAACMAENGVRLADDPILGLALDGSGLGDDGTIWGGEVLLADYQGYRRLAHLKPVPLPGGVAAVREPWRNAYAYIVSSMGWPQFADRFLNLDLVERFGAQPLATLDAMMCQGINAPLSSSCGRLFDAAAALCGVAWGRQSFEGEAAMLFEAAIDRQCLKAEERAAYPFVIRAGSPLRLDPAPALEAMLEDRLKGASSGLLSARFHLGLAEALARLTLILAQEQRINIVALSGGCFQNATLFALLHDRLAKTGLHILSHSKVPCNDGGLSLGQAAIGMARSRDVMGG